MPWRSVTPMDERLKFVSRFLDGESMTELCREYGISRKTGYKFLNRYRLTGGIAELSRKPHSNPKQTPPEIEQLIIDLRRAKPAWGPKKLKAKLEGLNPGILFPASSTMGEILLKHDLVLPRRRRRFQERLLPASPITTSAGPNQVWCTDFKGQFQLGNKRYCYPLTVTDHFSRYLIGCESLENQKTEPAKDCFEKIFEQFGVPQAILSDNGAPFGSTGFTGLSRLSVWWMSLGIKPLRIEPGCPEQNGRHERMHLTLKEQTTRPAARNHLQQQEKFDDFRQEFNEERPHEALNMKTPGIFYQPSRRSYREASKPLEYPLHDEVRKVTSVGQICLGVRRTINVSAAFAGQTVGLRSLKNDTLLVTFAGFDLGYIVKGFDKLLPDIPKTEK